MLEKLTKRLVPMGRLHQWLRWPILALLLLAGCLDGVWAMARALGREIRSAGHEAAAHLRESGLTPQGIHDYAERLLDSGIRGVNNLSARWSHVQKAVLPVAVAAVGAAWSAARQWCLALVAAAKVSAPESLARAKALPCHAKALLARAKAFSCHSEAQPKNLSPVKPRLRPAHGAPRRAMAAALALTLCLGMLPVGALVAEGAEDTAPTDVEITALEDVPASALTAEEGAAMSDLALPDTLRGVYAIAADTEVVGYVDLPASWSGFPAPASKGEYPLTAQLDVPEGFTMAADAPTVNLTLTGDPAVDAVRTLMAALPTPEEIAAMTEEERTDSGAYDKMDVAYSAYAALSAAQKALLPDAEDTFAALQGVLNAAPVTLAGETYPIVISAKWASPAYICAGGTPLVIEEHKDSTFNMTCTTVYIDKNGNGIVDTGEPSLKEAGITNAPADNDTLNGYSIYGGGYNSTTKIEKTQITMNGGQVSYIYGGGGGSGSTGTVGTTKVTMTGGQVDGNICGGGNNGCVAANTNVTIKGGTVKDSVYGGNGANDTTQVTTNTTILIEGGKIEQSVLGGSGKGTPVAATSITVRGTGVVKMYVRGANSGEVDGGKTNITIGGGAQVGSWAYHSGVYLYDATKPTNVQRFAISPALTGRVQVVLSDTYDASSEPAIATGAVEGDSGKIELYYICAENYVTYFDGGTIKVKPKVLVDAVSLDNAELTFTLGETATQQLTATVAPENADNKTVTWKSSNTSIATVNASGLVTAVGKGTAIITATAGGKTATCAVTVKLPEIPNKDTITVTPYGGSYDGLVHDMVKVTGAPEGSTITYSRTGADNSYNATIPTLTDAYIAASVWVKVSCAGYEDYVTKASATITRVLLTPAIDMSGYTLREYDGTTAAAGAKIILTGNVVSGETPTATATVAFATADAGENKTVSATGIALGSSNDVNKNYMISATELLNQPSAASITAKEVPVVWTVPNPITYTGASLADKVTAKYVDINNKDVSLTVSFAPTEFQNAGDYTATATMTTADNNYTLTEATTTKEVTIGKATPTITPPAGETHDVTSVTLTAATTTGGGTITYGYSTENNSSGITNWKTDLEFTGLKSSTTYYFFAKAAANDNYNEVTSTALAVTTTAKSLQSIAVTTAPTKTAYTAFETFNVAGMEITAYYDDTTNEVVTVTDAMVSYPDNRTSFIAGDTSVTVTYNEETTTQTVTVNKADGGGTVTLDGWTYGGTANTPVPVSDKNGTTSVTYGYKVKDATGDFSAIVPTNAGDYIVQATFAATANYTAATATADFTIAKRVAEFTWTDPSSPVYDGEEKTVSVTVSNKVGEDTVTCVLTGDKGTNADTYTAKVESLSNDNYTLEGSTATTHAWSITPLPAALSWNNTENITYDGAVKTVTATVSNAATDDSFTLAHEGNTAADAGDYTAKVTALGNKNYTLTGATGTEKPWTIAPKTDATLTIELGPALTYTGVPQTQTVASVKVGNTDISNYDVSGHGATNAETYNLTVAVAGGNYKGSTGTAEWSIAKAPLTVTANNHTITYGAAPAGNGVSYAGFVNGEDENVLAGTLAYDHSYTQFGDIGSNYTITPKGLTSGNYEITFATGTLTVEQKEVGLTWTNPASLVYDGAVKAPTVEATGAENSDALGVDFSLTSGNGKDVGTHTYTANGLTGDKAGNYKLPTDVTHTFTITAAPPTGVKATGHSGTYDGAAHPAITVDTTSMTGETKVTFSKTQDGTYTDTLTVTDVADSGEYWYKLVNQNYSDFTGNATVTIAPKALTDTMLTVTGSYTYTGAAQPPTFTATDAEATLTANDYTVAASDNVDAGTASLTLTGTRNYTGTATQTFTIDQKPLADTMIADIDDQVYTDKQLTPVPTVADGGFLKEADYTVSHGANINVADGGTVTITATDGNYSGTASKDFKIIPRDYDADEFTITITDPAYTGAAVTPEVSVVYNGMTLVNLTDYTVEFSDNIAVGTNTAKASFEFTGNYGGTAEQTFSILNNPLEETKYLEAFGETADALKEWHTADIKLTGKGDWKISTTSTDFTANKVTLATEGAASKQMVYLKKDGELKVYQTTVTYALDKEAPTITDVTGNPTEWTKEDTKITFTTDDTTSGVDFTTVKLGNESYTGAGDYFTADRNGDYVITVTDNAGNKATKTVSVTKIDKAAPTAVIATATVAPESGWFTEAVTVNVTVTDDNPEEWKYTTDGSSWEDGTGTSFTINDDGNYTAVQVKAIDAAGNEALSNVLTVKLDTTAPAITGVTGNATAWQNTDVTLTIAAADATSDLADEPYSFDGGATWQAEPTKDYSANETLAADTIQVRDVAGNVAKYGTEIKIEKIDKVAPTVTLAPIPEDAKWYGETVFTLATDDDASGVKTVTADGGTLAGDKLTVREDTAGAYAYTVTVTDGAGNSASASVTISLDPVIDTFAALVDGLDESALTQLLDALDTYAAYTEEEKTHILASDKGAAAKTALEAAFTALQNELLGEVNGIIAKHPGTATLADIDRAEELYGLLDEAHKADVDDKYQQMLRDRDAAKAAIEQLSKEAPTYEEMQTAQNTYDSLSESQQALVNQESGLDDKLAGLSENMEAINAVIEMTNAIQRPFKPETRGDIFEAVETFNALNGAQKELFPEAEYQRLIVLAYDREDAEMFIQDVEALTVPYDSGQKEKILGCIDFRDMIMTPASLEMVPAEVKTKLEELYSAVLQAMDADEKAAEAFTQKVWQAAAAPSVSGIEALSKAYEALSIEAKAALSERVKDTYESLIATLTDAVKALIKDLDAVESSKLTPQSKDVIAALNGRYDDLSEDAQALVDAATGGKLGQLTAAVAEAAKAEEAIDNIKHHADGSDITAGNCDGLGHTIAEHKSSIETAKLTYERLTDAGRALVSADAKTKLSVEYTALMKYLDYKNTADTASTKVEVAGLAEKVQLPPTAPEVTKTVIQVTMKDEKVAEDRLPATIAEKKQALSVDIKLEVQNYKGDEAHGGTISIQPMQGETVLVKLKVPAGYQNDTLEIWHVKDSGPARQIAALWLVTETDGVYAVFEVASFSHFVLFAEETPSAPSGSGNGNSTIAKPMVDSAENGSVNLSPAQAKLGEIVTITAKPDEGYVVGKVMVTDQNGRELTVKDNGDGTYSYTQPAGKVTVVVTFESVTTPHALPFGDVTEDDWFYDSVKYVYANGLMNGTATDAFNPYQSTSRSMVVTILWRLEGEPEAENALGFYDVPAGAWHTGAVAWAVEHGIVEGYGNGSFAPEAPITREQLAVILYRYAQFKGMDTTAKGDLSTFTDQPSSWAAEAVEWAVGAELISGKGEGILDPTGQATRAETAKILTNFAALAQD